MAVFVPDASATLAWFFEDESSDWTEVLLARLKSGDSALVPQHWPVEVANAFLMAMRRGRISDEKVARFFRDLRVLPIRIDPASTEVTFAQVFAFAQQYD
jgi:predicted nucleic acid-binding protein